MNIRALADLQETLTPHVPLGKSRLETLCLILLGMISARTVNLTHIASERPSRALVASTYRRLQRFFQHVCLPEDWSVGIVISLLADREFIGQEWFAFLVEQEIPFAIRMKEDQIVRTKGRDLNLRSLLSRCRGVRGFTALLRGRAGHPDLELHFGARRIKGGELLVVASSSPATGAHILRQYKKRWLIECLFADSKTRGLNIEDTRLTLSSKLSLLIAITAIAIALICRTAAQLMGHKYPARKKHGYCSKSWFRTGFDEIRRWMRSSPEISRITKDLVVPRRLRVGVV